MDRLAWQRAWVVVVAILLAWFTWPGPPPTFIDVDWRRTGFDAARIAELTRLAERAYRTPTERDDHGAYRLVAHYSVPSVLSVDVWDSGVDAGAADAGAADVVVAFSGTPSRCAHAVARSSALVWMSPVAVVETSTRPAPAVPLCTHRFVLSGLVRVLAAYRDGEGTELADWLARREAAGANVTFTGHSRGGVAAMLMAHYEMAGPAGPDFAPRVLAVSAPPTFCAATVARLDRVHPGRMARTLTVSAAGDPVVALQHTDGSPTPADGCADAYAHAGMTAEFADGALQAVQHRGPTKLGSIDTAPHAVAGVARAAECLADL